MLVRERLHGKPSDESGCKCLAFPVVLVVMRGPIHPEWRWVNAVFTSSRN